MICAVVLAAGASTRFGSPKQRLLLPEVLERVSESAVDDVVVVLGAHPVGEVGARTVWCPEWADGPGASLRCGLRALSVEVEAAVVVLADGPDLSPRTIDAVIGVWRGEGDPVVAASYAEDERSHPVLLAREVWDRIPDEGARRLPARLVPCSELGFPGDVDFEDDLPARLKPSAAE